MVRPVALFALVAMTVGGSGCSSDAVRGGGAADRIETASREATGDLTTEEVANIAVHLADEDDFAKLIERKQGAVVLVDFWATWCGPCIEQFPHTVEMSRKYRVTGLAVVSVSLDEPEERAKVLAFLKKQGAAFDNLISEHGASPRSMEAFDIDGGAVPHYKLYDVSGKLRFTFSTDPLADEQFTTEDIESRLQELLDER